MSRSPAWLSPRSTLAGMTVLVLMFSLVPARWTAWAAALNGPLVFALAPVQAPVRSLAVVLRGPEPAPDWLDPHLAAMTQQRDEAVLELQQARRQIDDLRTQIRDLSRGVDLVPDVRVKQIPTVAVIGGGGDTGGLVTIKAGRRDGVELDAVAVLRGVHLVGRVRRVDERTSAVQKLTDKSIGQFIGVVTPDEGPMGPLCFLEPDGRGNLVGRVQDADDPNAPGRAPISEGMLVRLSDATWPQASQMLVLGRIAKIERQVIRQIVTVKPEFTIDRVSDVALRLIDRSPAPTSSQGARP